MDRLRFGTAGIPHSAKKRSTVEGIIRIYELGLGCMELEFVQGVKMGEELAMEVNQVREEYGIVLSAHAPYFINLNAKELEKIERSRERIKQSARILKLCGGQNVVFHAGFYLGREQGEAVKHLKAEIREIADSVSKENPEIILRPETTGKDSQMGSLKEVICWSEGVANVLPCIDFSHLYARSIGRLNSYRDFAGVLEEIKEKFGEKGLNNFHAHVAGMEYGPKGEKRHVMLEDSGFNYCDLLRAFKDYGVKGTLICESPKPEEDALLLKETYEKL